MRGDMKITPIIESVKCMKVGYFLDKAERESDMHRHLSKIHKIMLASSAVTMKNEGMTEK